MSLSPLKFSLGVSLLVHGIVIGGATWLGQLWRTVPVTNDPKTTTLELVAAPTSAVGQLVETVASAIPPIPNPPQPTLPAPKGVVAVTIPEPRPAQEAILPEPPQPVETVKEPVAVTTGIVPSTPINVTTLPDTVSGDNSSPLPGKDHTTVTGSSTALAQPGALANLEPEYPLAARRRRQEGTVIVSGTVSTSGAATDVVIVTSSGYELLDDAAVKFARTWKFTPAYLGATPIESKVERPIRFRLLR